MFKRSKTMLHRLIPKVRSREALFTIALVSVISNCAYCQDWGPAYGRVMGMFFLTLFVMIYSFIYIYFLAKTKRKKKFNSLIFVYDLMSFVIYTAYWVYMVSFWNNNHTFSDWTPGLIDFFI